MEKNIELMKLAYKILEDSLYFHNWLPTEDDLQKKLLEVYNDLYNAINPSIMIDTSWPDIDLLNYK